MNAPLRFHALVQQAQNRDPTQTLMIRRRYEAEVNKRFRALKGAIRASIVDRDVFGLTQPRPFRPLGNADQTSFSPLPERAFQFSTMPEKVDGFMTWLEDQQSQGLLEISSRRQLGHAANSQWQNVYLQSAYQKGVSRARLEMQKAGVSMPIADQGNIKESVSAAFNRPFHADRVGSIYARAYNELKGVTQAMDTAISRALSDGLLAGKGPLDIARDINKQVDGIGIARARLIARTETIRAHHVATIQEYRNAGVLGIKVKAEWLTAGDSRVCAECAALQGRVFTLDEIEPLIPLHPQCRCVALPVDVTDEEEPAVEEEAGEEVEDPKGDGFEPKALKGLEGPEIDLRQGNLGARNTVSSAEFKRQPNFLDQAVDAEEFPLASRGGMPGLQFSTVKRMDDPKYVEFIKEMADPGENAIREAVGGPLLDEYAKLISQDRFISQRPMEFFSGVDAEGLRAFSGQIDQGEVLFKGSKYMGTSLDRVLNYTGSEDAVGAIFHVVVPKGSRVVMAEAFDLPEAVTLPFARFRVISDELKTFTRLDGSIKRARLVSVEMVDDGTDFMTGLLRQADEL